MSVEYTFRVWCIDDMRFEYTTNTTGIAPSVCPVNVAHTIDASATSIIEDRDGAALVATLEDLTFIRNTKHNFTATTDPSVNDDTTQDYSVGSQWVNTTTNTMWQAMDVTLGAAVWSNSGGVTALTSVGAGESVLGTLNGQTQQIKSILAPTSNVITVTDTGNEIQLDITSTQIDHTQINNVGVNSHADIDTHIADTNNPHAVTQAQVGLSNVTNIALPIPADGTDDGKLVYHSAGGTYTLQTLNATNIPVDATAINYTAASPNVEAHLSGIDQVLSAVGSAMNFRGDHDVSATTDFPTSTEIGDKWIVTGAAATGTILGSINTVTVFSGDALISRVANPSISDGANWAHIDNNENVTSVAGKIGAVTLDKTDVGLSNVENLKVNLTATVDPTTTDDTAAGYTVGSRWINTTTDLEFVCVDATNTTAVWLNTSGLSGVENKGAGAQIFQGVSSQNAGIRSLVAATGKITLTQNTNDITVDVDDAQIDHTLLQNIGTFSHADIDTHINDTNNPHSVTKTQVGLSNVPDLLQNLTATTDPTITDDTNAGYAVGSRWINTTTARSYVCINNSGGAAVWRETTFGSVPSDRTEVQTMTFHRNNSAFKQTTNTTYTSIGRCTFAGSTFYGTQKVLARIEANVWVQTNGETGDLRVVDITNAPTSTLATLSVTNNNATTIVAETTITNIPTSGSTIEVQMRKLTGTNNIRCASVSLYLQ